MILSEIAEKVTVKAKSWCKWKRETYIARPPKPIFSPKRASIDLEDRCDCTCMCFSIVNRIYDLCPNCYAARNDGRKNKHTWRTSYDVWQQAAKSVKT